MYKMSTTFSWLLHESTLPNRPPFPPSKGSADTVGEFLVGDSSLRTVDGLFKLATFTYIIQLIFGRLALIPKSA
jgi:hypothetical protein